jgi:hypothetical protein
LPFFAGCADGLKAMKQTAFAETKHGYGISFNRGSAVANPPSHYVLCRAGALADKFRGYI